MQSTWKKGGIYFCEILCFKHHVYGKQKRWWYDHGIYRAFSLTWPASMKEKKRVQLLQDLFGTPIWPPFHCFGTPIWQQWRHVKTLYYFPGCVIVSLKCHPSLRPTPNGGQGERDSFAARWVERRPCSDISVFAWKQSFFLSFQKNKSASTRCVF